MRIKRINMYALFSFFFRFYFVHRYQRRSVVNNEMWMPHSDA